MMEKNIEKKVFNIFNKFVSGDRLDLLWNKVRDSCLTSEIWGFSALDMLVLYFEIEKEFNIKAESYMVLEYGFSTVNKILRILQGGEVKG